MLDGEELNASKRAIEKLENMNIAYVHQVFSSLEIILCNLRYSTNVENTTISNYILKMQGGDKISSFLKEMNPFNQIKLCNILFLYELFEEKLFKHVIQYISPDYDKPLEDKVKEAIVNFLNESSNKEKNYPTPEQLINVIQRFIIRCLVASIEAKFPIKEYLMRNDFWDLNVREDTIDKYYFDFPDDIFIFNTLPFLELIRDYVRIKGDEERFDLVSEKIKYDTMRQEMSKKINKF